MLGRLTLLAVVVGLYLGVRAGALAWKDVLPVYVLLALVAARVSHLRTLMPERTPFLDGLQRLRLLRRVLPGLRLLHALHAGAELMPEIARTYGLSSAQFYVTEDRLRRSGLVQRHTLPGGRRTYALTARGREFVQTQASTPHWRLLDELTPFSQENP